MQYECKIILEWSDCVLAPDSDYEFNFKSEEKENRNQK